VRFSAVNYDEIGKNQKQGIQARYERVKKNLDFCLYELDRLTPAEYNHHYGNQRIQFDIDKQSGHSGRFTVR
jgi:hypothetical protein